jgi:hypothetical protein
MEPETREMLHHLAWLSYPARSIAPNLRLEIAWGSPDSGPNRSRTFGISEVATAAGFAAWINRKGCNVYVGATLKSADALHRGRVAADKAWLATSLPVDCDVDLVTTAEKLAAIAKPQLLVLTGQRPEARGQLFVRIKPITDLTTWDIVHERLVRKCGGDENARGRGRLTRLAGSVSYPSPEKTLRGYTVEQTSAHFVPAQEYSVHDLLALLPAPPANTHPTAHVATLKSRSGRRVKPALAVVEAALRSLSSAYAVEHHRWLKVGFALFDFDQGQRGLELWQHFSQRCPEKAAATDFAKLWQGFRRHYAGHRITVGWLLREARSAPSIGGEQVCPR